MPLKHVLLMAALLAVAVPSYASSAKVFVFAAPEGTPDGFLGELVPSTLNDSVKDIRLAIFDRPHSGLTVRITDKRQDASIVVQVMGREEANGEYRVHVHVTIEGREADLTGSGSPVVARQFLVP
jgi:hypothetical protein